MRTYDQYCSIARALDLVGDRWTLLIVRELIIRGPSRYTDLQYGLPGIATNLLADRLRELEADGLVTKEVAPPPVATTLFRLTQRGEALEPVLAALGRWGAPLLAGPSGDVAFRSHWLKFPLQLYLSDHNPDADPATIEIRTGEQPMLVDVAEGVVRVHPGSAANPNATLSGTPSLILGLLVGMLDIETARARGLDIEGDIDTLHRVQPLIPRRVDNRRSPKKTGSRSRTR
jgi:DNA-binding HxlR family transcriptional regulator